MAQGGSFYLWIKRFCKNVLFSVPVAVAFLDKGGYIAKVEGSSMQPCLNPDDQDSNDYVLLNKWAIRNYQLQHGDIVALTSPKDPNQKLIKRIIATERETVLSNERQYINIPVGHCWVEGDHKERSLDSKTFGPVSTGLIFAKASHIVWPPARWQKLEPRLPSDRGPVPCSRPGRGWPDDEIV